jgi:hypothetical protein
MARPHNFQAGGVMERDLRQADLLMRHSLRQTTEEPHDEAPNAMSDFLYEYAKRSSLGGWLMRGG